MLTHQPFRPQRRRAGFTLIEVAIVTVIVGIGIVGMLELMAAGTMANTEATELTTAMGLVSNIHERALGIPYDQLLTTFNDRTYSPPADAKGNGIGAMNNWSQIVDFHYVDPNSIKNAVPDTQDEPTGRITVTISHHGRSLYTTSWVVAASEWP